MKRNYITPAIIVRVVKVHNILEGSVTMINEAGNGIQLGKDFEYDDLEND